MLGLALVAKFLVGLVLGQELAQPSAGQVPVAEKRNLPTPATFALIAALTVWPLAGDAQAQVVCTNGADALETGVVGERTVAGAPVEVRVSPKAGRVAPVTDLTVEITPGGTAIPTAVPGVGTISITNVRLPATSARAVITIAWNQGDEPGLSVACRGTDQVLIEVGPNARQLQAYLHQMNAAQRIWVRRRALLTRAISGFNLPTTPDPAVLFAYVRRFGSRGLSKLPPGRAAAAAYRDRVTAIRPHPALSAAHSGMGRSSIVILRPMTAYLRILSRATTLADITNARRALGTERDQTQILRRKWSRTVTAAAAEAGTTLPAWVDEIGR